MKDLKRALSTLGVTQQEFVINTLAKYHQISSKNAVEEIARVEETLKEILGVSVASFVKLHISDYVAIEFKILPGYGATLAQVVAIAQERNDQTFG